MILVRLGLLPLVAFSVCPPRGPSDAGAGAAPHRYEAGCGPVLGHSGNLPGYTQIAAATRNGRRSITVTANAQLNPQQAPEAFEQLRHIYELAVCAARAGN